MNSFNKYPLDTPIFYCKMCLNVCYCLDDHNKHLSTTTHTSNKCKFIDKFVDEKSKFSLNANNANNVDDIIKMNETISCYQIDYIIDICNAKKSIVYVDPYLRIHKYNIQFLEKYVHYFNDKVLLQTQILTAKFCILHILDMDIDNSSEDSYLFDIPYILSFQPHLNMDEMLNAYKMYHV